VNGRCYLVDENTTRAIVSQLRRLQPDMIIGIVGDEMMPPLGMQDPDILCWIEDEGYSLVTRNRKSMPRHLREHLAAGCHVPGIFTLRPNSSFGEIIYDLLLIWEVAQSDEYRDQIVHIPL